MDSASLQFEFKELLEKPIDFYYMHLLNEEVAGYLSFDEKKEIIESIKNCVSNIYNSLSPLWKSDPSLFLKQFGYTLHNVERIPFIDAFGLCDPNEQVILLNKPAIDALQVILTAYSSLFGNASMYHIALAHEIFHILEEQNTNLFTREFTYLKPGFFRKRRTPIHVVSEIGAFHFSMLAASIDFCPYILATVFDLSK